MPYELQIGSETYPITVVHQNSFSVHAECTVDNIVYRGIEASYGSDETALTSLAAEVSYQLDCTTNWRPTQ